MKSAILLLVGWMAIGAQDAASAQEPASGDRLGEGAVLYGEDFALMLAAPVDWVIDSRIGHEVGALAVMYPRDPGWVEAPAVIYVAHFDKKDTLTFEQVIENDLAQTRQESPTVRFQRVDRIETLTPTTVQVYHTTGDRHGNADAVAFIDQPNVVITVVMTAKTMDAFVRTRPLFERVVASYTYIGKRPAEGGGDGR